MSPVSIFLILITLQGRDYSHNVIDGWITTRTPYSTCLMTTKDSAEGSELWITMGVPSDNDRQRKNVGLSLYNNQWRNIRTNDIYAVQIRAGTWNTIVQGRGSGSSDRPRVGLVLSEADGEQLLSALKSAREVSFSYKERPLGSWMGSSRATDALEECHRGLKQDADPFRD